ncbi:triple tyrosine motif-containing protein [Mangrovibacterium sp.]|uniref:triple tyrosine motif-containing protein n=1 Tax=Mangrovibacterium sp. TaxID=1961364 RepID=UPI003563F4A9
MHFKHFILTYILFSLCISGHGQIKDIGIPEIHNIKKHNYRAGAQNWQIERNSKNFMYFANNDGLLEFDGSHWQLYGLQNPSVVRSIKMDENDRIYIGQQNEFGYMEPDATGLLTYHSLSDKLEDNQKNFDEVWRIHITNIGVIFQSYTHLFIYRDDRLIEVPLKNRIHFSFYVNGLLWIQDQEEGLMEYRQGKLVKIDGLEVLADKEIWTILPLSATKVLIGTVNNGVYIYDEETLTPWENEANNFLIENQIFSATKFNNSYFAFGTIQNGLMVTDESGQIIQYINKKKGLQNNTILAIGADQDENLWLGLDNGIDYIEINSSFTYIDDPEGLGATYSTLIHQNKLYVGTNHGLFVKDWPERTTLTPIPFRLIPKTVGQTWYLGVHDGVLLCGHNNGTYVIEGETATQISDVNGAWTFLSPNGYSDILIGGNFNGLTLFRKTENGKSWRFVDRIKGFSEASRLIEQDTDGNLWMSHGYKGVYKITLNDKLDSVLSSTHYNSKNGLPTDNFINLMKMKNNLVYTTPEGIYRYNKQKNAFESANDYNKLFDHQHSINYLFEDSFKNIWYSAPEGPGVLRFQEDGSYTDVSLPFQKLRGRQIAGFEHIYVADQKNTFIALEDGLAHYSPNYATQSNSQMKVFIREVLNKQSNKAYFPAALQPKALQKRFAYPFKGNHLRFTFTCPDYTNGKNIRYSYYLENYSSEWSEWSESTVCEFMNLREGNYTLKIKAGTTHGQESNIASFSFKITPPWYRSLTAYIFYSLAGLLLIILLSWFVYYRIQISKRKERLKHLQQYRNQLQTYQREALISEKEIIRLRNEKLHGKMIHLDKELANQTMSLIQKNKFLGKIKSELKTLQSQTQESALKSKISLIINRIDKEFDNQKQNELFETYFDEVHEDFFKRLLEKYPTLTPREMKLCAYIKMNISSKEIATLLNISQRGVEISRYRLRKKLEVDRNTNLTTLISGI